MKLKYLLKKTLNIKTAYILIVLVALILVVGGYFSYALFTTSSEQKGALNIVTGNLYSLIESNDLDSNKSITLTPGDDRVITIELKNVNGINSKHNLYYETTSNNIKIGYIDEGDTPPTNAGYVLTRNGTTDSVKTIKVRIKNKNNSNVTITFGTSAGLPNAELAFPQGKTSLSKYIVEYDPEKLLEKNPNILAVYRYNENGTGTGLAYTGCLGGEEAGCVDVINEINGTTEYNAGDVIKYQVNDTEVKYFNVLYDNDKDTDEDNNGTLTLQQRENTVYSTPWCSKEDYISAGGTEEDYGKNGKNDKGPITILNALENATKTWANVNNQAYTLGETIFGTGEFATAKTSCNHIDNSPLGFTQCDGNSYSQLVRTNVKARLITAQEASEMNCKFGSSISCNKFMSNYLSVSTSYGGSVNDNYHTATDNNHAYWTSSTPNNSSNNGILVSPSRYIFDAYPVSVLYAGARAVVNINKNNRVEIN